MQIKLLILLMVSLVLIFVVYFFFISSSENGKLCGGIAANLPERQCSPGYVCKSDTNYPDASGVCKPILSF